MLKNSYKSRSLRLALVASLSLALSLEDPRQAEAQGFADAVSMIANTASLIAQNRATAQMNQQLLQQLNSQEAQQIQAGITMAQMKLRNELTNTLMCLQRNSIMPASTGTIVGGSSAAGTARNAGPQTLGRDACTNPNVDISIYDQEMTCSLADRTETLAARDRDFNLCRRNQLMLLSRVVGCLDGFDNKLKAAAADIQKLMAQRTTYIKRVMTTFTETIDGHKRSAELIGGELEGPDGYKDQVNKLDNLLASLDDSLSAPAMNSGRTGQQLKIDNDTLEAGLEERVRHLSTTEQANVADSWFKNILGGTQRCYQEASTPCSTGTGAVSGAACLETLACAGLQQGVGYTARCNANKAALSKVISHTASKFQFNIQIYGPNASPYDPQTIVNAAQQERNRMLALMMSSIDDYAGAGLQQGFNGSTNINGLKAKMQEQFDRCFNRQVSLFSQSFNTATVSGNNPFKMALEDLRKKQLELDGDLDRWIRRVTGQMTKFRTKFTNVFSNELQQFKENCSAAAPSAAGNIGQSSQQRLACLKTLRARLEGGLNGTNGEAATVIQVPVINGTPGTSTATPGTVQNRCVGFKDCIQQLEVAKKLHTQQADTLKSQRQSQAANHNQVIEGIVNEVGSRMAEAMSNAGGFQMLLNQVNGLLGGNDISKRINLSQREGEDLEKEEEPADDERSRVYKTPKDILAVMGRKAGLPQITQESINEVKEEINRKLNGGGDSGAMGINRRIEKANRAIASARDKLRQCTPSDADYASLAGALGNCSNSSIGTICQRSVRNAVAQLESIAGKISTDDRNGRNAGTDRLEINRSSYSRCMRDDDDSANLSTVERLALAQSATRNTQTRDPVALANRQNECLNTSIEAVRAMLNNAREQYRGRHNEMLASLDSLLSACDGYTVSAARDARRTSRAEGRVQNTISQRADRCQSEADQQRATGGQNFDRIIGSIRSMNLNDLDAAMNLAPDDRSQDSTAEQFTVLRSAIVDGLQNYRDRLESNARAGRYNVGDTGLEGFMRDPVAGYSNLLQSLRSNGQGSAATQLERLLGTPPNGLRMSTTANTSRLQLVANSIQRSMNAAGGQNFSENVLAQYQNAARTQTRCSTQAREEVDQDEDARAEAARSIASPYESTIRQACEAARDEATSLSTRARQDRSTQPRDPNNLFEGT